jgi:hypothetical protein
MRKRSVAAIIVVVVLVLIILPAALSYSRTITVNEYVRDGYTRIVQTSGYGSRIRVSLSSIDDYMRVRVIVDGRVVYDNPNCYIAEFEKSLGFGHHNVIVEITNPTIFGLGKTILVSGFVAYDLF